MLSDKTDQQLQQVSAFWDANPCDGADRLSDRAYYRYSKDGWVLDLLRRVAQHRKILEVGCGQGTDAITCSGLMQSGGTYTAIDYSRGSIEAAEATLATVGERLVVRPSFQRGNAEALEFPDDTFDCVLSVGVLHHTPNTLKAIQEVHRVLQPDGTAYIALYRFFSPKVLGALTLRGLSAVVERIISQPGYGLTLSRRLGTDRWWGTMVHEAVGVPILKSYRQAQLAELTNSFRTVTVTVVGFGFAFVSGMPRIAEFLDKKFGAMWLIEARK